MSQPSGSKRPLDSKDENPKDSRSQKTKESPQAKLPTWVRERFSTRRPFHRNDWGLRKGYPKDGPLVPTHSNAEAYEIPRRNIIERIRRLPTPLASYSTSDFSPDERIDALVLQAYLDIYLSGGLKEFSRAIFTLVRRHTHHYTDVEQGQANASVRMPGDVIFKVWDSLARGIVNLDDPQFHVDRAARAMFFLMGMGRDWNVKPDIKEEKPIEEKDKPRTEKLKTGRAKTPLEEYQTNIDKYKTELKKEQAAINDDNCGFVHYLVLNCIAYFPSERPTPEQVSITCQQGLNTESQRKDLFLSPLTTKQNALIPSGLSKESRKVYHTLITVAEKRRKAGITPVNLLVITDLGKDYDDLAAMVILKELHRLGLIKLKGFVANLDPAQKRACFGRGALDSLGLDFVPIARGTKAQTKEHAVNNYEFDCDFMAPEGTVFEDGYNLIKSIYLEAQEATSTVSLLLISSLTDISNAATGDLNQLMVDHTQKITLQGGYTVIDDNELVPNNDAANNNFDFPAAQHFHKFIHDSLISSTVYTKVAAFATPLSTNLFTEMENTGHPIGAHLRRVEVTQDIAFYRKACLPPDQRFRPFMDRDWFLKGRTNWYDEDRGDQPFPEGDEIVPYLTKIVAYDALAAVGSVSCDVLDALGVLKHNPEALVQGSCHKVIGIQGVDDGVDGERMASVIYSLLLGSLLACQQGLTILR